MPTLGSVLESRIQDLVPELERVDKDIHAHPDYEAGSGLMPLFSC